MTPLFCAPEHRGNKNEQKLVQWSEDVIKADPFFGRSRVQFRPPGMVQKYKTQSRCPPLCVGALWPMPAWFWPGSGAIFDWVFLVVFFQGKVQESVLPLSTSFANAHSTLGRATMQLTV